VSESGGVPDEQTFPSTTWEWRKVKMKPPPAGHSTAAPKASRWYGLARWPRRRPLTLTIAYRGGPESWWLVTSRGRHGVFPGHLCLEDVMRAVMAEPSHAEDAADRFERPKRTVFRTPDQ
jgi:hypothetical protein